jgi:hypothetical protein
VKKFLFWMAVIVGILAAVAVLKRGSSREDGSWQGDLEDSKDLVTKAVNDAMSGPDAAEKATDSVDAAVEGAKDVIDVSSDTSKDVATKAKRATS